MTNRLTQEVNAKSEATALASAIRQSQRNYAPIAEGATKLGDAAAYEVVFSYTSANSNTTIKTRITSVVRGTQSFVVWASGIPQAYDAKQNGIDQLVRSFTLTDPKPFGVSRQDSMFYLGGEIVTLDPATTEDAPDDIVGAIFSGLVKIDKDLKVAPDIAERWDVSADGKTYTFFLREGAKFHSGRPVTAQDFKFSWERALDPKTESRKASTYLGDIAGAAEVLAGKATDLSGVRVIDDRTLEVTIDGPKPYFLGKIAYPTAYVVDRANVARGKTWINEPNGTGPFKLKQWKKDDLLVLERNDSFYMGPAKLKNVVFQLFAGRGMMMYEQGEIDFSGVARNDLDKVQDSANPLNKELRTGQSIGMGYLGFNVTRPPFDDPKVRRAFALALNMDKIIEVSLKGTVERAGGFIPPGIPGNNPDLKPLPFDPARAKQLIAESRYGSVDKLPPVTLYVLGGVDQDEEAMIGMWKQNLGVEVKVESVTEYKAWIERSHKRDFQLFKSGWRADYIDPQNFLDVLFQGRSEENRTAYSNPAVDAALKEAAVERNETARLKKYQEIERMILEDLPAIPYYQSSRSFVLVKSYVKGLNLYPIAVNHWKDVSVDPH